MDFKGNCPVLDIGSYQHKQIIKYKLTENKLVPFVPQESETKSVKNTVNAFYDSLNNFFFPKPDSVTENYWEYIKWHMLQRFTATSLKIFGTQSLLMAVGIGSRNSLTASATLNWILKDGIGKFCRLFTAVNYCEVFDSNLKKVRYQAYTAYNICIFGEFIAPLLPRFFLLLTALSNIGKSFSYTCLTSTSTVVKSSFAKTNLAALTAKTQTQHVFIDLISLCFAAAFTHNLKNSLYKKFLPIIIYPILTSLHMHAVFKEIKAIELKTLNSERLEIILEAWIKSKKMLTPREVSRKENLIQNPFKFCDDKIAIKVGSLKDIVIDKSYLDHILKYSCQHRYIIGVKRCFFLFPTLIIVFNQKAKFEDILSAFMLTAKISKNYKYSDIFTNFCKIILHESVSQREIKNFLKQLKDYEWNTKTHLFTCNSNKCYVCL